MAGCSTLLMVDVFTSKLYNLAEKQLVNLGGDTDSLGGGDGDDIYIVGSSHGWISLFNNDTLELFLWNPVTGRHINLPPVNNLPTPKNRLEGGYCHVVIIKLILSSSNPDNADCRVVVSYGPTNRLAFCCPSQSGADWISIGDWYYLYTDGSRQVRSYCDVAYSSQQNRLFCITDDPHHELERWDLEDPCLPTIDGDDRSQRGEEVIYQEYEEYEGRSIYIVIAEDEVLVVVRELYYSRKLIDNINDPHRTIGFKIFKVVQGKRGKITVHPVVELDKDLAMFVGLNHSFALSAIEFPELKPNSIYFTNACLPTKSSWWCSVGISNQHDIGIFDYQNKVFYPCYSTQEPNNHGSAQESNEEEDNGGRRPYDEEKDEESNEEEEDNGGRRAYDEEKDEESNEEEEDNGGRRPYDEEKDGELPQLVWFRPTSQV